ncbi:hypothetical protein IWQ60_008389 [Tieghemiomyces parasiticus]|uniref:Uncharacterized protein n=1 Tax=Tieghemiomyces parasiticus TaxID=78921 RepID=A0A9W8A0E9_9FUNG|nr:hypothetical protein IWQ60_008389 [Tieghemiomyces parasiticus]
MDISRSDFPSARSTIEDAIAGADFIAIDAEFSGLYTGEDTKGHSLDGPDWRYHKLKQMAETFSIIQFGLTAFHWRDSKPNSFGFLPPDTASPSSSRPANNGASSGLCAVGSQNLGGHGHYEAMPFNFYLFPTSVNGRAQPDMRLVCQNSAFDFLAKSHFNFNRWVYEGIPYMTPAQELRCRETCSPHVAENLPDILIDERNRDFFHDVVHKLRAWLATDTRYINIVTANAYQKRLVFQEVRKLGDKLFAEGRSNFVHVVRATPDELAQRRNERLHNFEKDIDRARGFNHVIDMLIRHRKPLVGHNLLLDLCHLYNQFCEPLPPVLSEFKSQLHHLFPLIIDTKTIAESAHELRSFRENTSLEVLYDRLERMDGSRSPVVLGPRFSRYTGAHAHEAGYDALMTGVVLIRELSVISAHPVNTHWKGQGRVDFRSALLLKYVNRLFLTNSDLAVLDLVGTDVAPVKPNVFYVKTISPALRFDEYPQALGTTLGQYLLSPMGSDGCFITLDRIPPAVFQTIDDITYLLKKYCTTKSRLIPWVGSVVPYDQFISQYTTHALGGVVAE